MVTLGGPPLRCRIGLRLVSVAVAVLSLLAAPAVATTGWTVPLRFFVPGGNISYAGVFDSSGAIHAAAEGGLFGGLWYATQHGSQKVVGTSRFLFELNRIDPVA